MAEVKWIKLSVDIFDNRKIRQIETMPDGDSIVVIWLKLLCLAGTVNDNGLVYLTRDVPYTEEMLASQFGKPISTVRLALATFERFGMIEIVNDFLMLPSWEKYQNVEGLEKVREQTKARVAKHREGQRLLIGNVTGNVTVTPGNATDIDIEEDKDIDKELKNNGGKSPPSPLEIALKDFEEMRTRIRKPLTKRAHELLLGNLEKMAPGDDEKKIAILNQSIFNSWQGVFPLRDACSRGNGQPVPSYEGDGYVDF